MHGRGRSRSITTEEDQILLREAFLSELCFEDCDGLANVRHVGGVGDVGDSAVPSPRRDIVVRPSALLHAQQDFP